MRLFECGIRYVKTLENGMQKKVTELYVVDALTFSEAESRITGEMAEYISGEFEVVSEKITNYSELVMCKEARADKWYRVKINLISVDERTGRTKKAPVYLLVQAGDIDHAREMTNRHMRGSVSDWECEAVQETKVMDVFTYEAAGEERALSDDAGLRRHVKDFADSIPDGQKVTLSAPGCEDVVIDKTHGDGRREDDAG